jgi:hypothetical protein
MKPGTIKVILIIGFSSLLASILACRSTPIPQQATNTIYLPPTGTFTPASTPGSLFTKVSLVSRLTEETEKKPAYTVKAQTPFFQGSEDPSILNFNNEMALLTLEEIAKFKDLTAQTQPVPDLFGSSYEQEYELLSPAGNLVSVKFKILIYIQGAAHPWTHVRTKTYDLEAGSDVPLSRLFLPGVDYLARISNYCISQLKTRDIGFDPTSKGAQPIPENYGNWNVTTEGLLITFDQYQVAAGAAGPQEVNIPYTELKSIIDLQGPLAGFIP